jgi:hypothetical protein
VCKILQSSVDSLGILVLLYKQLKSDSTALHHPKVKIKSILTDVIQSMSVFTVTKLGNRVPARRKTSTDDHCINVVAGHPALS